MLVIARQIAEALAAGHEAGVIHRDLKPANIKLKHDGTVKVLDYGLAKAFELAPVGADSERSKSPTLTRQGTQVGVILGTAAYMSPEQAKGKSVDKRTDVWAFGAVVYEMLTGERAFEGNDVSRHVGGRPESGVGLHEAAERDSAGASSRASTVPQQRRQESRARHRGRAACDGRRFRNGFRIAGTGCRLAPDASLVAAVFASLVTGLVYWGLTRAKPPEVTRFAYDLPADHQLRARNQQVLAASPDGRRFGYNTIDGLYLRSMDELEARVLPGTEPGNNLTGATTSIRSVFFSPDGRSVAYDEDRQLKRLAVGGGAPVVIGPTSVIFGAHWAADDTIFFADIEGIFRVSANGGTPELAISAADGEILDAPHLLPGGDTLLFSVTRSGDRLPFGTTHRS